MLTQGSLSQIVFQCLHVASEEMLIVSYKYLPLDWLIVLGCSSCGPSTVAAGLPGSVVVAWTTRHLACG